MDETKNSSFIYSSTRCSAVLYNFEEVLVRGYAPDGGLFMPCVIPRLNSATLGDWSSKTYPEVVIEICKLFISPDEIPHDDLEELVRKSFANFHTSKVIETTTFKSCMILELFHGPTYAFKDLAMSCTMSFLDYFLTKRNKHLNLIVSTSGDTGAAAMEAAQNSKNLDVTVLYPLGRVTEVQELQMTTIAARAQNMHLFALQGTSDDGDDVMRALFNDTEFVSKTNLSNVNSINWSRILIQIAHWFYGYYQVIKNGQDVIVEIVCPTGAGGNLAAGCIAHKMGLPVKIIACTNLNDCFEKFISQGIFSPGEIHRTLANAMDIQIPYNIERILHVFAGGDPLTGKKIAQAIDKKIQVQIALPSELKNTLKSVRIDDEAIVKVMRRCFHDENYLVCPHTATALSYHYQTKGGDDKQRRRLIVATASAIKFSEALQRSELVHPDLESYLGKLRQLPQKVTKCNEKEDWIPVIRAEIMKTIETKSKT